MVDIRVLFFGTGFSEKKSENEKSLRHECSERIGFGQGFDGSAL